MKRAVVLGISCDPKIILSLFFGFALLSSAFSQTNSLAFQSRVGAAMPVAKPGQAKKSRHYYIAAESQLWDFAPEGRDVVCGRPFPDAVQSRRKTMKVRYVEYTDETFTRRVSENPSLGILGPVLRGVVGDELVITFWNRAEVPLSMHPHGVKYDKDSEGSFYQPDPGKGAAIVPGAKFTYVWELDESSGPLPSEPSSKAWLYHSHVKGDEEVNLGLIGFIIVTDPKRARPDGTPAEVDRELASLFMIFDETGLSADEEEEEEHARRPDGTSPARSWAQLQELKEQGERYAINGRIFGNLTGLEMNAGERVRWYLFGLGSENDFHTPHWHGLRVIEGGRRTDTVELLPASMKVADMVADNPGAWLFHCHVAEHMMEGMFARVIVHAKDAHSARRAPDPAFFGLSSEQAALQIPRAEALLDFTDKTARSCEITVEGEVPVPNPFPVFSNAVRIQLGRQSITFKPGRNGMDEVAGGTFQVDNASKNSSEYGIVYGGRLKFDLKLSGAEWRRELIAAGLPAHLSQATELMVPLMMEIGGGQYRTMVRMVTAAR